MVFAQDRVNSDGYTLNYKSKELKKATFWSKGLDGKWESRKNNLYDDGIDIRDNFISLYFGKTIHENEEKIIFFKTYWKGKYRYPHRRTDWTNYKTIKAAIIPINQYDSLQNIQQGDIIELISSEIHEMFMGNPAYSESFFLNLLFVLTDSDKILHKKKIEETVLVAKRTISENKDVVRFMFDNILKQINGKTEVNNFYFEIPYTEFSKLIVEKPTSAKK